MTLGVTNGPAIDFPTGVLAIADPWNPCSSPEQHTVFVGKGAQPTQLSTIEFLREGHTEPWTIACAAALGRVGEAATWRSLVQGETRFHLDVVSSLGAFYDIANAAMLRPLFENDDHMFAIYKRTLDGSLVMMELQDRVAAGVFLCPDGPWRYPIYVGFDKHGTAIAALIDLATLNGTLLRDE